MGQGDMGQGDMSLFSLTSFPKKITKPLLALPLVYLSTNSCAWKITPKIENGSEISRLTKSVFLEIDMSKSILKLLRKGEVNPIRMRAPQYQIHEWLFLINFCVLEL